MLLTSLLNQPFPIRKSERVLSTNCVIKFIGYREKLMSFRLHWFFSKLRSGKSLSEILNLYVKNISPKRHISLILHEDQHQNKYSQKKNFNYYTKFFSFF